MIRKSCDKNKSNDHAFVCIVTYGRSGSTLLQVILQSIPGYFIRGENYNVLYAFFLANSRVKKTCKNHGNRINQPTGPWYGADEIKPRRIAKKLSSLFVDEIIQPPEDARVIGFKEIRFHEAGKENFEEYLNYIYSSFNNCKFVFNKRNWSDVSKSGWWVQTKAAEVERLIGMYDQMYSDYQEKYPSRCFTVSYDEICKNPSKLQGLFDFLGEEFCVEKISMVLKKKLIHLKDMK